MREIAAQQIADVVSRLCIEAAYELEPDVLDALRRARDQEESPTGREVLEMLLRNADVASQGVLPLCQDTGLLVAFVDLGQDVHIVGGELEEAITQGVRRGYDQGYLRKSVVTRPFSARINSGDNTPPVIHVSIVPGDSIKLMVVPKGAGSENMSAFSVLTPSQGRAGIIEYVVSAVERAGAKACPPLVVGVGIGGTAEKAMLIAKRALLRQVGRASEDEETATLERELLARINALGIGPQGLGGRTTALAVHVETYPCHIASLPVAVNLQCHSARHKSAAL